MRKKQPFFEPIERHRFPSDPTTSWLGKPVWVRGQVRVSLAHAELMRAPEKAPWFVQGERISFPAPFLLPIQRST